ncbi:hypothetical protein DFS33DRAFT_1370841 [Desarmillaria ectypa]|nr:hypothetical protein DFS33DRAFT_1370841 [Desarmillaria ectypa]
MEARNNLFSRGSTPPVQQPQPQYHSSQHLSHNISSTNIDTLFQHINSSSSDLSQSQSQQSFSQQESYGSNGSNPTTPMMSVSDEPSSPHASSNSNATLAERQNALLSLLAGPPSNPAPRNSNAGPGPTMPQQIPTPPGGSQPRSGSGGSAASAEAQGKLLLEQLMAGTAPRSNYSESPHSSANPAVAPSPPYQSQEEYRSYGPQYQDTIDITADIPRAPVPSQPQQQLPPQSAAEPQKTMFDFVSPFDALSSTSGPPKKKAPQPATVSSGGEESSSWTSVSDPKRRSVENLLEQMTNIQSYPQQTSPYDLYDPSSSDYTPRSTVDTRLSQADPRVPPPPLPPKPAPGREPSPRLSPPKTQAQRARMGESPASQQGTIQSNGGNRRDKESSPGPRGGSIRRGQGRGNKNYANANSQPQTIIFDVSQPLDEIQAPRDSVKSTAIALVKQETVFLPGTTIGATHWVAYAMSRGRVRVISRSNGDRTLLQLPPTFGNASVSDMAVFGNRLAGVTSDGGFVVWELPEVITDDVPGTLLLCVAPLPEAEPLQSVKWHPKDPDTLAVASDSQIYLIDLANVSGLHGPNLTHNDLRHIGHLMTLSSSLVAFDFDTLQYALLTISTDSTLTTWNIQDRVPYASHKIRGEDTPSSLTYADGVIVVGRKNGTVFQLLSSNTKAVLSTIKFINSTSGPDELNMFGHVSYDARIQTLWIANSRRDSMIAFKLNMDSPVIMGDESGRGYVEQVVEFSGPKPTIHFVILTADADPNGDEAYAACIAAKVPPGELALAAFSVHSSGVDQILIRREWFDIALGSTTAKYPPVTPSQPPEKVRQAPTVTAPQPAAPPRLRTPPSEEVEVDVSRDEGRIHEPKGKGQKGKNVTWGGKDDNGKGKEKENTEVPVGQVLTKEMKKLEDSLHTRITRSLNKEMDKQQQRFEDARAHEQAEDFARQEKILKLISTELTRNTTRVVEVAVKNEVQNSVLPSLESITRNEVKTVLNDQLGRGLTDLVSRRLPAEMETLLLRPEFSNKLAQILASNINIAIDRQVKEVVSQILIPEIHNIKGEITRWQSEVSRSHETSIGQLERSVRLLSEQVKFQSSHPPAGTPPTQPPASQSLPMGMQQQQAMGQPQLQMQARMPMGHSGGPMPQQQPGWYPHDPQPAQAPLPSWYRQGIAAPQPSHPAQPPPPVEKPITADEMAKYENHFVEHLSPSAPVPDLLNLLSRTNIDTVLSTRPDVPTLSQTCIIVIIHRTTPIIDMSAPSDPAFKLAVQWMHRALQLLRLDDNMMLDYAPRVMPTIYRSLGITEKRLSLLPEMSSSTNEGIQHLREIRAMIERKVPSVMRTQASAASAGSSASNAGQA